MKKVGTKSWSAALLTAVLLLAGSAAWSLPGSAPVVPGGSEGMQRKTGCAWQLTNSSYGQAGCSGGSIGGSPAGTCSYSNEGEVQSFSGCAQFIDWSQDYTCVCD